MNKAVAYIAGTLAIFAAALLLLYQKDNFFAKKNVYHNSKQSFTEHYSVAIMLPVSHPSLDEIKQGFIETLQKQVSFTYEVYNGNGDRILMRNQCKQIAQRKYDLVCTIATPPALLCKEVFAQRSVETPVIALAVSDPVGLGLASPDNNFVIVSDSYDFDLQLQVLTTLHKTRTIVAPYYPSPELEQQITLLKATAKNYDIEVIATKIYTIHELFSRVDALVNAKKEVIMVLKDNLVVSGIESLINLAQKKQVPLYVSDLNSVDMGAALGFGVQEYSLGVIGAQKALLVLHDNKKPRDIPIHFATKFKVKINRGHRVQQNLFINKLLLLLTESTIFVGENNDDVL
jgi:putative tryptophan/tyrosine transport system substrate-binding protein